MAAKKSVRNKADLVGKAVEKALGYVCFWTLHEQDIPVASMEAVLNQTLGAKYLPAKPRKKRALKLALEAVEREGLIVKIRDDEQVCAYGLGAEVTDAKKIDFSLKKQNIIVLDKKSGNIDFRMDHKNKEIEQAFNKYLDCFTDADVPRIALDFIYQNAGITLRDTGGVYFIPEYDAVQKLDQFFRGCACEFFFIAQASDEHTKGVIRDIAVKEFEKELELAAAKVQLYTEKDDTRGATLKNRLLEFQAIRRRAEIHVDALNIAAGELFSRIDDLRGKVEKAILGDIENYPQAEMFPVNAQVRVDDSSDEKWNGRTGRVVAYDWEGKGEKAEPLVKVLWDDGEFTRVYANPDWLKVV